MGPPGNGGSLRGPTDEALAAPSLLRAEQSMLKVVGGAENETQTSKAQPTQESVAPGQSAEVCRRIFVV